MAERARLEIACMPKVYRGFESPPLRFNFALLARKFVTSKSSHPHVRKYASVASFFRSCFRIQNRSLKQVQLDLSFIIKPKSFAVFHAGDFDQRTQLYRKNCKRKK